ncbi:AfsA-related hotdog domain-containing protein [Streptomyces sp. NPDC048111]|uniref:AfsA-related hotdog domain-containing protein n=1 Tax=Streptomyces sp. NPDC048111 TaxID=3365500 RepID=UPI0037165904
MTEAMTAPPATVLPGGGPGIAVGRSTGGPGDGGGRGATAVDAAAGTESGRFGAARHLIHCPPSWDHCLDAPSLTEEHFVLADRLPRHHPLFNDGAGRFHDQQVVTESVREIGEFVGHRYFGVPAERPGLFYRFDLDLTDLAAWRTGQYADSRLSIRIRAVPGHVVGGVPRALDFHVEVSIDAAPCATGSAGLVFLMPALHAGHLAHARSAVREAGDVRRGPLRPVDAAAVGRAGARNVLLANPEETQAGRLTAWVRTQGLAPALCAADDGVLPGLHVLETLRQTALLCAGRGRGLHASRSALTASRVHFRGYAQAAAPLRCAAVPGPLERDAQGRPAVPVSLTLTHGSRAVAEATTLVVQDF